MIRTIIHICGKELKDGIRDRRSVLGAVSFTVFMPALLALVFTGVASQQEGELPTLHVENARGAPHLIAHLREVGYEIESAPDDMAEQIQADEIALGLRVDSEFGSDFSEGRPARIHLLADESRHGREAGELASHVQDWGREIASLRLILRGVSTELIRPVELVRQNFATPAQRSAQLLGGLIVFLLIAPFVAGMSLAIDSLAGERERRSLEMLMVQPVHPLALLAGKWLATVVFGVAGVVLMLAAAGSILPRVDLSAIGLTLQLPVATLVIAFVVIAPIAFLSAALQSLVSLLTRSFKEAQLYMSGLMVVPMIAVFAMEFMDIGEKLWQAAIPVLAQYQVLTDLLRGETPDLLFVGLGSLSTLILAVVALWIGSILFRQERVVLA